MAREREEMERRRKVQGALTKVAEEVRGEDLSSIEPEKPEM